MRSKRKRHSSGRLGRHKKTKQGSLKPCPAGSSRNPKTKRCNKDKDIMEKPCPKGKTRNPQTKRCRIVSPTKPKTLKALPENQEYNIFRQCKKSFTF